MYSFVGKCRHAFMQQHIRGWMAISGDGWSGARVDYNGNVRIAL